MANEQAGLCLNCSQILKKLSDLTAAPQAHTSDVTFS